MQLLDLSKTEYSDDLSQILSLEMELLPILASMELEGVRVDKKKLTEIGMEIREKISLLE